MVSSGIFEVPGGSEVDNSVDGGEDGMERIFTSCQI